MSDRSQDLSANELGDSGASEQHLPLVGGFANADINTLDAPDQGERRWPVAHARAAVAIVLVHEVRLTKPDVAVLLGLACETASRRSPPRAAPGRRLVVTTRRLV